MSIFMVMTYVVKPEKQGEFMSLVQRFFKYKKGEPREVQKGEIIETLRSNVWWNLWRVH